MANRTKKEERSEKEKRSEKEEKVGRVEEGEMWGKEEKGKNVKHPQE